MIIINKTNWLVSLLTILSILNITTEYAMANKTKSYEEAGFPEFITTWQTTDTQITIPTFSGETYNYDITWTNLTNAGIGDGSTTGATGNFTITGLTNGDTYQITISGTFPRIYFNKGTEKDKILTIENWGNQAWTSFANAFYGCSNLNITDTAAPDLSGVTDLSSMFRGCSVLNADLSLWDVATVTNMSRLFQDATLFNGDITTWDVSSVQNMSYMFFFASAFNQDISSWHTGNVLNMYAMFGGAIAFNQPINTPILGNGEWDVSKVTDMNQMFSVAVSFNQDISNWDVNSVNDMGGMFNGASSFNQPLNAWGSKLTAVTSTNSMFKNATSFNQPLDNWDVANIINMGSMFASAFSFNQDLSTWGPNVSGVTNMRSMFAYTTFNQDITGWDVGSVTDFNGMFQGNLAFNQDISGWTTTSSGDFRNMFDGATAFDQNLGGWDISNIFSNDMYNMLNKSGLSVENYDATLTGWVAQNPNPNVQLGAQGLYYCSAGAARTSLITLGWLITDAGQGCMALYEGSNITGAEVINGQNTAVDFGTATINVTKSKTFTILNRLSSTTLIVDAVLFSTGTNFSYASPPAFPISIPAGSTQTITINFDAITPGTYTDNIALNIVSPTGTSFTFPITGKATATDEPEIKVFDGANAYGIEIVDGDLTPIDMGSALRGSPLTYKVTVLNTGVSDLSVNGINFSGSGAFSASSSNFTLIPNASQTIDITLAGTTAGSFTTTMSIASNDTDENPYDFVLTGTIDGPVAVVVDGTDYYSDPTINTGKTLDLGTTSLGNSITKSISVTNTGPLLLTVNSLTLTGTGFSTTANSTFSIAGNTDGILFYNTFDIKLDASNAGNFTGTLTLLSDDDITPVYTVNLTGVVADPNAPKLYWSDANEINRSNLDGTAFEQYHTEPTYTPRGLAKDTVNNIMYWTNNWGQIKKGTIAATGLTSVTDFLNDGINTPREMNDVAIDAATNTIYWISTYDGKIKKASLAEPDPANVTSVDVVTGLSNPIGIALDPIAGFIYYTENNYSALTGINTATLHQVKTDGTGDIVFSTKAISGQYQYLDVTVDVLAQKLYWTASNDDIYSPSGDIYSAGIANVSGTESILSFTNILPNLPYGIEVDSKSGIIYWSDFQGYMNFPPATINSANTDGTNDIVLQQDFPNLGNAPLFLALDEFQSTCATPPTANAGTDATVCVGSPINLAGTTTGAATTTWTTSGDGNFANATSLSTTYTMGTTDSLASSITFTLTTDDPDGSGPCTAATDQVLITLQPLPTISAGSDQTICSNGTVALTGSSSSAAAWTTSGDGGFTNTNTATSTYNPGTNDKAAGTVTLTYTIDDPGVCAATSDSMVVTFVAPPTVDAGADDFACPSTTYTLNGIITGSSTGFSWSTSGDGSFANASGTTIDYMPGTTDTANGSVTISLAATTNNCGTITDTMVLTINQPIAATNQNGGMLKVNETVTINPSTGATINTGDVLTTTIETQPAKGTTTINNDGTIAYTASTGNVGADSFDFRITNQCGQFSIATAMLTIENEPPTINSTTANGSPGGKVTVDVVSLIDDLNGNIDLSSIRIIQQPGSGAVASLDANNNLVVDYSGIIFFGTDEVVLEVCDTNGACSTTSIFIEVAALPIVAFNALSPNGDGKHDFLEFEYIEAYPNNTVKIFNRWGDVVFEIEGYNNKDVIFTGVANKGSTKELPTGTYYFSVAYKNENNSDITLTGFFELRR